MGKGIRRNPGGGFLHPPAFFKDFTPWGGIETPSGGEFGGGAPSRGSGPPGCGVFTAPRGDWGPLGTPPLLGGGEHPPPPGGGGPTFPPQGGGFFKGGAPPL